MDLDYLHDNLINKNVIVICVNNVILSGICLDVQKGIVKIAHYKDIDHYFYIEGTKIISIEAKGN